MTETADETMQTSQGDPTLAVSVTLAELELLRADATIAMSQLEVVGPDESVINDLSPLGQRRL
jgi:hypothetical protein